MIQNLNNQSVHGTANYSQISESFSFHPLLHQAGELPSYKRTGTAQQLTDGSFEFQARPWNKSHAEIIKLLSHGRLTKTVAGDFLLTIRVPEWKIMPECIIAEDSMDAMNALRDYLNGEEAVAA